VTGSVSNVRKRNRDVTEVIETVNMENTQEIKEETNFKLVMGCCNPK
jgi:hypothetical protein